MDEAMRSRAVAVVLLVALGAGLGVAGDAVGVAGPATGHDPAAEFVVAEDNVSVERDGERTVLRDIDVTETVQIERVDDGYRVSTDESGPLTETERQRAKRVARENETVAARLGGLDGYDLRVEPIRQRRSDRRVTASIDVNNSTSLETNGTVTVDEFETVERRDDAVVVDRAPAFVEGEVVVAVRPDGSEDAAFDVHVDLENETVTAVDG